MSGEQNLQLLLKGLQPILNEGEYVFVTVVEHFNINQKEILASFNEKEGLTLVLKREKADELNLSYDFIAKWITISIHSALDAVGLTAAISTELTKHQISCNVIAAFYHDHIFVSTKDADKAMIVLSKLSRSYE